MAYAIYKNYRKDNKDEVHSQWDDLNKSYERVKAERDDLLKRVAELERDNDALREKNGTLQELILRK